MNKEHANMIRLTANEILRQLHSAGEKGQIELLYTYAKWALEDLQESKKEQ